MTAAEPLTARQRQLYEAVIRMASHVSEQLLLLPGLATRVGASARDITAVKERLLAGHVKECRG